MSLKWLARALYHLARKWSKFRSMPLNQTVLIHNLRNTLLKMWQNLVMQQPTGKGLRKSMVEQEPQRTAATERRLSDAQSNSKNEARTRNTIASHMKGDDPENIERLVDTGSMRRQDRRLSTVDTVESVVRTPSTRLRRKSDQQGKVYGTQDLQQ